MQIEKKSFTDKLVLRQTLKYLPLSTKWNVPRLVFHLEIIRRSWSMELLAVLSLKSKHRAVGKQPEPSLGVKCLQTCKMI